MAADTRLKHSIQLRQRCWVLVSSLAQHRAGAVPGASVPRGTLSHALPSLSHGTPALPRGSLPPLITPQAKGSSAQEGLVHPSPGGTHVESATTAIPRELQNKPEAPAEIYAGFSSSMRNRAPSVSAPGSGTPTSSFLSHIYILLFFFESKNLSEEIMTLKLSYL